MDAPQVGPNHWTEPPKWRPRVAIRFAARRPICQPAGRELPSWRAGELGRFLSFLRTANKWLQWKTHTHTHTSSPRSPFHALGSSHLAPCWPNEPESTSGPSTRVQIRPTSAATVGRPDLLAGRPQNRNKMLLRAPQSCSAALRVSAVRDRPARLARSGDSNHKSIVLPGGHSGGIGGRPASERPRELGLPSARS